MKFGLEQVKSNKQFGVRYNEVFKLASTGCTEHLISTMPRSSETAMTRDEIALNAGMTSKQSASAFHNARKLGVIIKRRTFGKKFKYWIED